ncbi:neprilysin-1-like [Dermacentor andersoni]|uniref:neprilysin-1-like n=1 Tax=Dermacentor andersoni TaxID=34620 RepID=UPI003B3AABE8
MPPSRWQLLATTSVKSSPFALTMSDRVGRRRSSTRLGTFARNLKVRFGNISFLEYTASRTSAVIQKNRLAFSMCVAVAFLLVGAFMLFVLLIPEDKSSSGGTRICDSDECLRAFYYLDRAGDLLADPCHDFHRYVCYHWRDNDDLEQMSVSNFYYRLDNNLRFDSALELGREPGGLLFARAYRSCYQFLSSSGDANVTPKVADHLKALVQRFSADLTTENLIKEIVRTSITQGIDVIFGVSLAIDGLKTYPSITRGKSLREKLGRQFGDYLNEDIVNSFVSLPNSMVSELVKIDDSVQKAFYGNMPTTELHDLSMLSNLTPAVRPPVWSSLFQEYLNLSHAAKVLVADFNKIRDVVSLLSTVTKKEALGAYLSLQAVADVLFLFIQKKYFFENLVVTRNCLEVTCRAMAHFCEHVTSHVFGWSSETRNTIQNIYDAILRQYDRSGPSLWSAAGNWLQIAEGLRIDQLVLLPTVPTDIAEAAIARYETLLKDWPDNYPEVYSFVSATHKMVSIELPLPNKHRYLIEAYLRGFVFYSDLLPGLLVPTALTAAHMTYSSRTPIELNLGTLGSLMAKALVLASTPFQSGSSWNITTRRKFKQGTMCIFNAHSKMINDTAAEWDETTASTLFAWSLSVQLALGSLLAVHKQRALMGDDSQSKAAQRTLMRRFCLLSCGASQESEPTALAVRARCLVPLTGLHEFAEAFGCPKGSAMNPTVSCHSDNPPILAHAA